HRNGPDPFGRRPLAPIEEHVPVEDRGVIPPSSELGSEFHELHLLEGARVAPDGGDVGTKDRRPREVCGRGDRVHERDVHGKPPEDPARAVSDTCGVGTPAPTDEVTAGPRVCTSRMYRSM